MLLALNRYHCSQIFSYKTAKRITSVLTFMFLFELLLFPYPILAKNNPESLSQKNLKAKTALRQITDNSEQKTIKKAEKIKKTAPASVLWGRLPESEDKKLVKRRHIAVITAYNSDPAQTDNTPCITANGFNVCEHGIEDTVAANFLPFGTRVRIPELYGDKIFIVRDRMNKRYSNRMDIWMKNKKDALRFGKKIAKIEILK